MNPAQCREKMSKLIAEESTGLAQLSELLEHEHGLLAEEGGGVGADDARSRVDRSVCEQVHAVHRGVGRRQRRQLRRHRRSVVRLQRHGRHGNELGQHLGR